MIPWILERRGLLAGACSRPHSAVAGAFSLVEVVLAIGVISFALVAIIGLFPVASRTAVESQRETRAALIAQQIFADLRSAEGTDRFVVTGPDPLVHTNGLNLSVDNSLLEIAYDQSGTAITNITAGVFSNSYTSGNAAFLAQVLVTTNSGLPNLSRIEVTVQAPAPAPATNRSSYTFITLMSY